MFDIEGTYPIKFLRVSQSLDKDKANDLVRELNQAAEKGIEMIVFEMKNSTLTSQQNFKLLKFSHEMARNLGMQLFIIRT